LTFNSALDAHLLADFLASNNPAFHRQTFSICFARASLKLPWLKIG
jgi:hypothetical protein